MSENIEIEVADYANENHAKAILTVLESYARDPMGLEHPLSDNVRETLIPQLHEFPTAFSVLAWSGHSPVGLANCFLGFSTFSAGKLVNIHDLAVMPKVRGKGVGQQLLDFIEQEAIRRDCVKITLEVRQDNPAQRLYKRNGFKPDEPVFEYWTKTLSGTC